MHNAGGGERIFIGAQPQSGRVLDERKKLAVMEALLHIKFGGKEPLLTRALLSTGEAELVEGNTWDDTFWGVCNGEGENHLGKLLMNVRTHLAEQKRQIEQLLPTTDTHEQLASTLGLTQLCLYEKMMAFGIPQKKYFGY